MKNLKIIIIYISGFAAVLFLSLFVFIKTFDVNKFLPQLTQNLSKSINRPINITQANLDFSFKDGFSISLEKLEIGSDNQSPEKLLDAQKVNIKIDIWALLKRQIQFDKIDIIKSEINYTDSKSKISFRIPIERVQIKIPNFSLNQSFDIHGDVDVLSKNRSNIEFHAKCLLDLAHSKYQISNLIVSSDLALLDLKKLQMTSLLLRNLPVWPENLKGKLSVNVAQLNITPQGLEDISINVDIDSGYMKLKEINSPIENITVKVNTDLKVLNIKQFNAYIGSGQISVVLDIADLLKLPKYTYKMQIKALSLKDILKEDSWPFEINGLLAGSFSGTGESFDSKIMLDHLKGSGEFALSDAKLEKLNLLNMLVDKLSFIPSLGENIRSSLSPKLKEKLDVNTVVLDKVQSKVSLLNKVLYIDDADVESPFFSILSKGNIDSDLVTNITINAYIESDLSTELIHSIKVLGGLLDESNRLYIPGDVTGKIPQVSYKPKIDYLTRKIAVSEGSQQLEKILDKNPQVKSILNAVLGGEASSDKSSLGSQTTDKPTEDEPAQKLINNVLNKILK